MIASAPMNAVAAPGLDAAFVSVVVPTHHRPEQLERLLASLLAQTYPAERFEVIVVPSPGDGARDVLGRASSVTSPRLRCEPIPDDPWHGRNPSAKRNHGAAMSRGDWIAYIDDDCIADSGWLARAAACFNNPRFGGIEGRKEIPVVDPPTMTYRGLLRFTSPGGYQTCNMFYRRDVLIAVGGFDEKLPFYLEDSDLAWTVLEAGYEIPFAADAVVRHPVPSPDPWRLLEGARRSILLPYLHRKHPGKFVASGMRALRPVHWCYLFIYAAAVVTLAMGKVMIGLVLLLTMLPALLALHLVWSTRGCRVRPGELTVTALLYPIVPVVSLWQLWRGNLRERTWLWT